MQSKIKESQENSRVSIPYISYFEPYQFLNSVSKNCFQRNFQCQMATLWRYRQSVTWPTKAMVAQSVVLKESLTAVSWPLRITWTDSTVVLIHTVLSDHFGWLTSKCQEFTKIGNHFRTCLASSEFKTIKSPVHLSLSIISTCKKFKLVILRCGPLRK